MQAVWRLGWLLGCHPECRGSERGFQPAGPSLHHRASFQQPALPPTTSVAAGQEEAIGVWTGIGTMNQSWVPARTRKRLECEAKHRFG